MIISIKCPEICFPNSEKHLLTALKYSGVLCVYLLLSLILPKSIPPLHEVGQTQEVHHLSFPVDQSTENWCISVKAKSVCKKPHCYIIVSFMRQTLPQNSNTQCISNIKSVHSVVNTNNSSYLCIWWKNTNTMEAHTCWVHRLHPVPECLCPDSHPSDRRLPQPADLACKEPP